MMIREMFAENINRPINGVIKVDQDAADVIEQEVREYVITKELKKHFISFFNYYSDAISTPTSDIGVWISGFFGSGKSHFLKMLSYILQNKPINGIPTVELFRKKFADDPATFMQIDRSTRALTEAILFNIDIEGPVNKDKTAVLRVFAKMFYSHLGFYGSDLKVAMLEQYIEQQGKTEAFRRAFAEKKGSSWEKNRKAYQFNSKFVIPAMMETLDISEEDARRWFADKSPVEFSIASLVEDIKAYVSTKPRDFRLLFMIDEVGQYVGTDTDMLLNLQSIIEKIGSECGGKVWVMCTGQEAIDEIIKVRSDEFSRIQARFKTRLSLSSSSVDEVIQKRVLQKTPKAEADLEAVYETNDSVLRNLFSFRDSILDIKGFSGATEFAVNFPFVPYQFIIMQKVFAEIRKHGNSGKHLSGGERSMLSGFQEAAQKIQEKDEYALVPFFRFYDTVHTFLDSSIRRVIERCQKAAENQLGIQLPDVDLLKLLYLIRYVDDIPANVDNLVILMADDIRTDKIILREQVRDSLNRLLSQGYIGRSGEVYNFLTDEEQDIQREINATVVDTAGIVNAIASTIFADIYTAKKFRYAGKADFDFDKMVDGTVVGSMTNGMCLRFLTVATDETEKADLHLRVESKGKAICVLPDSAYYDDLENAMKIRKYVKQRNVSQLPRSMQDIIRAQQEEAGKLELESAELLRKAITEAAFYADGELLEIRHGDAKSRIDQALEYLVAHVYSEFDLIRKNADTDADILALLSGSEAMIPGTEPNREAAVKVEEFLTVQDRTKLPTSMADVQARYQGKPYGWKEIDIAAVVALLICQQKVTIKYGGTTIQPTDSRLPDMLRKKSEIGKTSIMIRKHISDNSMRRAKKLLREYFDLMDVPADEDGLVAFIVKKFTEQKEHLEALDQRYENKRLYPDRDKVHQGIELVKNILSQQRDNIALIDRLVSMEDDLLDSREDLQQVESFFRTQVQIFDAAVELEQNLLHELDYLSREREANDALNRIRMITTMKGVFNYRLIPELNALMQTVREGHNRLLAEKRNELLDLVNQCMGRVHAAAAGNRDVDNVVQKADTFFEQKRQAINESPFCHLLDSMIVTIPQKAEEYVKKIKALMDPPASPVRPAPPSGNKPPKVEPKKIKNCTRLFAFPAQTLSSEEEIDEYLRLVGDYLKRQLKGYDGIELK